MHIIQWIRIGHKNLLIGTLILLFNSCIFFEWEAEPDDYYYIASCRNDTDDTLIITFYNGGFASSADLRNNIIYPDSSTLIRSNGVMKGEDPVNKLFSEWRGVDSCWIYKLDKEMWDIAQQEYYYDKDGLIYPDRNNLRVVWDAPLREMDASINHFFNYNSWESWFEDGATYDGIVQFTIYDSDLNQGK